MQVTKKNRKYVINEILNQKAACGHPNIVKFYASYLADGLLWVRLHYEIEQVMPRDINWSGFF